MRHGFPKGLKNCEIFVFVFAQKPSSANDLKLQKIVKGLNIFFFFINKKSKNVLLFT